MAAACVGAVLCAPAARAGGISGTVALTSDYVWRGSTQSSGDPAVQAGLKYAADSGFYASAWGSSVEFAAETQASTELDFAIGWSRALDDDWALDLNVLRYQYPATAVDLDWTELNGTLTYRNDYWVSLGYSGEALGYDASGTYALVGARIPLGDAFRLEATLAHYFLDAAAIAKRGYTHGLVSAVWGFKAPFELRLSVHATDAHARAIFGNDNAGSRVEAALQASF